MGFFKDFKDDFSQAIGELLPGGEYPEADDIQINTLDGELDVDAELKKLDGLLEPVPDKITEQEVAEEEPEKTEDIALEQELVPLDEIEKQSTAETDAAKETDIEAEIKADVEPEIKADIESEIEPEIEDAVEAEIEPEIEDVAEADIEPDVEADIEPGINAESETDVIDANAQLELIKEELIKEDKKMDTMTTEQTIKDVADVVSTPEEKPQAENKNEITDEVSVITAGTRIKGNMETTGSFEIEGTIEGDIQCNGKLTVIGTVIGNSSSSEFFADAAHVEGEVISSGTVKVGLGSVIIGNITATSAVIAGAVKGDIDVQGPVVVDTSAVIMGNIKSRSVQINNGAVIEGFCSQCYSDVDVESLFSKKN